MILIKNSTDEQSSNQWNVLGYRTLRPTFTYPKSERHGRRRERARTRTIRKTLYVQRRDTRADQNNIPSIQSDSYVVIFFSQSENHINMFDISKKHTNFQNLIKISLDIVRVIICVMSG